MSATFDIADLCRSITEAPRKLAAIPKVFPFYIARQIRNAMRNPVGGIVKPDGDFPGAEVVGDIETVGDCKYLIRATDANGTRYRVIIEVEG